MTSFASRFAAKVLRTRWVVRAPIGLYRAHLGFLFGKRLIMIEHLGRTSGVWRRVVVEVVDHDDDSFSVIAGFGEKTQWLRNLEAHPDCRIFVGTRYRVPARAERLSPDEAGAAIRAYAVRHPGAWEKLVPVFEETLGAPITLGGTSLPMVRLKLAE
ncbi:MAG: nitroreductase family deazaflavin-dependent oxidoreductase [Pseudolysinimonas sp.]